MDFPGDSSIDFCGKIYPGNFSKAYPENISEIALESPPESDAPEHPAEFSSEITSGIPLGISLRVSQGFYPRIFSGISLGTYPRFPAVIFRKVLQGTIKNISTCSKNSSSTIFAAEFCEVYVSPLKK